MRKPLKSLLIFFRSLVFWCILLTTVLQVLNLTSGRSVMSFMAFAQATLKFTPLACLLAMLAVFRFAIFSEANKPITLAFLFIMVGLLVYFAVPTIFTHFKTELPIQSYSVQKAGDHALFITFPQIFKNTGLFITDIYRALNDGMRTYLMFSIPLFFAFFMYGICTFLTDWKMLNVVVLLAIFFGTFYAYSDIKGGIALPLLQRFNIQPNFTTSATFTLIAGVFLVFAVLLLSIRGIKALVSKKRGGRYE